MSNNSFTNNSAEYGPNIASIPYKIVEQDTMNEQIHLTNIPSGLRYQSLIRLMLVDREGQVMNLENEAVAKIRALSPQSKISGVDFALFTRGVAEIDGIIFEHYPGANNIQFTVSLTSSEVQVENAPMFVSFRY